MTGVQLVRSLTDRDRTKRVQCKVDGDFIALYVQGEPFPFAHLGYRVVQHDGNSFLTVDADLLDGRRRR